MSLTQYTVGMIETQEIQMVMLKFAGTTLSIGRKNARDFFPTGSEIERRMFEVIDAMHEIGSTKALQADLRLVSVDRNGSRVWQPIDSVDALIARVRAGQYFTDAQLAQQAEEQAKREAAYLAYEQAKLDKAAALEAEKMAAEKAARQAAYAALVANLEVDGNQWMPDNAYLGYVYPQGKSYGQQVGKLMQD